MTISRQHAASQNPLIDDSDGIETLDRVRSIIHLLEDIYAQNLEINDPKSQQGIYNILSFMDKALEFEIRDGEANRGK